MRTVLKWLNWACNLGIDTYRGRRQNNIWHTIICRRVSIGIVIWKRNYIGSLSCVIWKYNRSNYCPSYSSKTHPDALQSCFQTSACTLLSR